MMFEIGMAIISSFVWLLGFVFMVVMGLFVVGFTASLLRAMYDYVNPGKE